MTVPAPACDEPAVQVFLSRHRFKMFWVYAKAGTAQMIKVEAITQGLAG